MSDTIVTTTISGAKFADGSTLSGTWTADYDSTGTLVSVSNASFTVSGTGGTTTFSSAGTLPYANKSSNGSYEIRFGAQSGGVYKGLYVDWTSEHPSSFYEGSPSIYTSVVNPNSSSGTTPLRLVSDGSSGTGTLPVISGLPATESDNDNTVYSPFGAVSVTDPDSTTSTSASISLTANGVASDADGVLSGAGLTKTGTGTYSLAFTTPANLTAELHALKFTPTQGQVAVGGSVNTSFRLSVNDSDGSASASTSLTVTAVCFLRGVMIAAPSGEIAVEHLRPGDLVTVLENGTQVARPVQWVGGRCVDTADYGRSPDAFPVRVRADAFADGVPHRDLLITPEHCILTEAGLIPARMLVNGGSILVDRSIPVYDFFHVELASHGILLAEGLATESYLDTGNRALFSESGAAVAVRPGLAPAAPLAVARALVEPIWRRLAERAAVLGYGTAGKQPACTDQPDLRLLLDDGRELSACWHNRQRYMFHIPCGARPRHLLSRAAIPAEIIGPFVDDRRTLGVAVDQLVLWSGLQETVFPADGLTLDGWHAAEGSHRWTNGRAALDMSQAGAETFLDVHLAATGLYPQTCAA